VSVVLVVSEMEIVVLGITNSDQEDDSVDDRCACWVLSEVLCLVSTEETLWLDIWCSATRKLFVETDYSLHTCGILRSA